MRFLYKKIYISVFLAALMMIFLSPQAFAKTDGQKPDINVDKRLKQCSEIMGRVNRLLCYDELAKALGYVTPSQKDREETVLENYGFWEVVKKRNAAGEEIIYLKNDAVEDVISQSGLKRRPTFVIKCKHGKTEAYLDWKTRLLPRNYGGASRALSVMSQLGSEERVEIFWELSTDRNALFAPEPVELIKKMREHDKMVFQVTPPYDNVQIVVHDISGINKVLKILVDECYD